MNFSFNTSRCFLYAVSFAATLFSISASANTDLAFKKIAIASTSQGASLGPANAFDGNSSTRWASSFSASNSISVDLGAQYEINRIKLNWEIAYAKAYEVQFSTDNKTWSIVYTTQNSDGGLDDLSVKGMARYVRMNGTARATEWGYSLWDFEVFGAAHTPKPIKISYKKTATASSNQGASLAASFVLDGNPSTRWASDFSGDNWIAIDLGSTHTITDVKLHWETAFASGYHIQTSNDGSNWTSIYSTTSGNGGIDSLKVSGEGRYIRMNGTKRATAWGYSIWEFEVFGYASTGTANPSSSSKSSNVSSSSPSSSVAKSSNSSSSAKSSSSVSSSSSSSSSAGSPSDGSVTLDWYIPNERENGEYLELDEIGGYEIKYKKTTDNKFTVLQISDAAVTSYTLENLSGNYEFYIATYDMDGIFSKFTAIQPH